MNERNTIQIFQQIDPPTSRPFRLIEVMITSDGYRSRLCEGSFYTFDEAEVDRQERIKVRSS